MGKIKDIRAREILDSRGNPTVEATVMLEGGARGTAKAPSGASVGRFEAHERRDGDQKRYHGMGVLGAVEAVNGEIRSALLGRDSADGQELDRIMITLDGTENKARLGANGMLAVSMAIARAEANYRGQELYEYLGNKGKPTLPIPMLNIINGGVHASNNLEIQEFMIIPVGDVPFSERIRKSAEIYKTLGKILSRLGYSTAVGDEGGYAPNLGSDEDACRLIMQAIFDAGYDEKEIKLGLDVASSEWWKSGIYEMPKSGVQRRADELCDYYEELTEKYPIISIEDGMGEDDPEGWRKLSDRLGDKIMLVGDDLFVTNKSRVRMGIDMRLGNAVLIKPNQIGTLWETSRVIKLAKANGYRTIASHRSGETDDAFISDMAVAYGTEYIKAGAPARGERLAKYNRLTEIEAISEKS